MRPANSLGAFLASGLMRAMFLSHANLGTTAPAGPALQSFVLEAILTAMLMFVVLAVSSGSKEKGLMAGIAVGGVIAVEAIFAGPICGASMNPARSLAPAVVSGSLTHVWIYLAAPTLGAAIGVVCCRAVHPPGCCLRTSMQGVIFANRPGTIRGDPSPARIIRDGARHIRRSQASLP